VAIQALKQSSPRTPTPDASASPTPAAQFKAEVKSALCRRLLLQSWNDLRVTPPRGWGEPEAVVSSLLEELTEVVARHCETAVSFDPGALGDLLNGSRTVVTQIMTASPQGELFAAAPGSPLDADRMEPVIGCPDDGPVRTEVLFTVFPGYRAHGSPKVNVKARVFTTVRVLER
jgi:hypothetical protein